MAQFKNAYEYLLQLQNQQQMNSQRTKPLLDSVTPQPQSLQINLGDNPFGQLHNSQCIEEVVPEEEQYKTQWQNHMSASKQFNSEYRTIFSKPESTKSYESSHKNLLSMLDLQNQKQEQQDQQQEDEDEYIISIKVRGNQKQSVLEAMKTFGEIQEIKKIQKNQIQKENVSGVPSLQIPTFQKQSLLQKKNQDSSREHSLDKGSVFLKPIILQRKSSPFQTRDKTTQDSGAKESNCMTSKKASFHIFSKHSRQ